MGKKSFAAFCLLTAAACGSTAPFIWVEQYRDASPAAAASSYVLAAGDVIQVRVFNQEGMSARTRVRTDGKITLPFLNDVQAEGYEPTVLAQQIQARLKDFINEPVVTVSVEEPRQLQIVVTGEVGHGGVSQLPPGAGVLAALVTAGGLTDFANDEKIFVVRSKPEAKRIRFTYASLLKPGSPAGDFRLRSGDIVVVE